MDPVYTSPANRDVGPARPGEFAPLAIGPLQIASLGFAVARLDRMAKQVPLETPWTAPRAREWDARTAASWVERNTLPGTGRTLLSQVPRSDPFYARAQEQLKRLPQ